MKKRALLIILSVIMLIAMVPSIAFADGKAPVITYYSPDITTYEGGAVFLKVEAENADSYAWYFEDADGQTYPWVIVDKNAWYTGQDSEVFRFIPNERWIINGFPGGDVYACCTVSNQYGRTYTRQIKITVLPRTEAPYFSMQPEDADDGMVDAVMVFDTGAVLASSYEWWIGDEYGQEALWSEVQKHFKIEGQGFGSLYLTPLDTYFDQYYVYCTIRNSVGSCTSKGAKMTIADNNPFTDVSSKDYFYRPVKWALENNITKGISASLFGPEQNCTRAQVVTFLWRAVGCPEPKSTVNPFTDVKSSDYFYKPVLWAVEKGITKGISANAFGPDASCTRAQVVTFMWREAGQPAPKSSVLQFSDVSGSDYFLKPVLWAVENDITKGTTATLFGPNDVCTRAHVVTFLSRHY